MEWKILDLIHNVWASLVYSKNTPELHLLMEEMLTFTAQTHFCTCAHENRSGTPGVLNGIIPSNFRCYTYHMANIIQKMNNLYFFLLSSYTNYKGLSDGCCTFQDNIVLIS